MGMKVGICDNDRLYMQRLMAYVNGHANGDLNSDFIFYGFTDAEQLKESARRHETDLILISPEYLELFADLEQPVLCLIRERSSDGVFKYTRADKILEELKARTAKESKKSVTSGTTVIGVCSPLGRSGKTRLAKGICECCENSLYIAFGDYQARGSQEEVQLTDRLLFMIASRDESFYELNGPGARELLKGAEHMELRQLSWEDVAFMISVIKERAEYERVVLDLGTGAMSDLRILLSCDRIIVPTLRDDYAYERLDVFKKQLSYGPLTGLNSKIAYAQVPQDDASLAMWIRREVL